MNGKRSKQLRRQVNKLRADAEVEVFRILQRAPLPERIKLAWSIVRGSKR